MTTPEQILFLITIPSIILGIIILAATIQYIIMCIDRFKKMDEIIANDNQYMAIADLTSDNKKLEKENTRLKLENEYQQLSIDDIHNDVTTTSY